MTSVIASLIHSLRLLLHSRAALQLEIIALRHQLTVVHRSRRPRLRLTSADRLLWVCLSRVWRDWRSALHVVTPETVVGWHRRGFRLFWTWKSRRRTGRPGISPDVRALIRQLSTANPLWGAPRIHGELQKPGVSVSQSTVAKYMRQHPRTPSQTWRTFLTNHSSQIMAADLFVVPMISAGPKGSERTPIVSLRGGCTHCKSSSDLWVRASLDQRQRLQRLILGECRRRQGVVEPL